MVTYVYDNGGAVTHLRVSSKGEAVIFEPKEDEKACALAEKLAVRRAEEEALERGYEKERLEIQVERTDKYLSVLEALWKLFLWHVLNNKGVSIDKAGYFS